MNKKILQTKKTEIAKAGKLVFDAIFGETRDFERHLEDLEHADTLPSPPPPAMTMEDEARELEEAITVEGFSFVSCDACGRRQRLPSSVDVYVLERQGWQCRNASWRCPFCAARTGTR